MWGMAVPGRKMHGSLSGFGFQFVYLYVAGCVEHSVIITHITSYVEFQVIEIGKLLINNDICGLFVKDRYL